VNETPDLVALLGPTAVGKTQVSMRLAELISGEIVSADSRLLYRGMDIGTAKPTSEERARVPHHLIDVTDPERPWSLATFRQAALKAIRDIHQRGRLPLIVGGTGMYLTAILEGWSLPPKAEDADIRRQLFEFANQHGSQALHSRLANVDPAAAEKIDHRNVRRVVRAMEMYQVTGVPPSQLKKKRTPPFQILQVGLTLPRPELYARIDARIDDMLEAGLVDEVRALLARGVSPELPAMTAIGYRQIIDYLKGEISLEEAVKQIRRQTRQLVRRQANWFKDKDPQIHWFQARPGVEQEIADRIRHWLKGAEDRSG
jgi:tRNA dimethylallyltransferase